jgi:hypothetical protein
MVLAKVAEAVAAFTGCGVIVFGFVFIHNVVLCVVCWVGFGSRRGARQLASEHQFQILARHERSQKLNERFGRGRRVMARERRSGK